MKPSLPYAFIIILCHLKIGASNPYSTSSLQPDGAVQIDSDTWISQLYNTEHNCSQHSPATLWLRLEWQGICEKHLIWIEYVVHCSVMLGSIIKQLGQLIKQGRLHMKLHFALFKSNWSVLQIINYFEMDRIWLELHVLCFSLLLACLFTPYANRDQVNCRAEYVVKECLFHPCTPLGDFDSCIYE